MEKRKKDLKPGGEPRSGGLAGNGRGGRWRGAVISVERKISKEGERRGIGESTEGRMVPATCLASPTHPGRRPPCSPGAWQAALCVARSTGHKPWSVTAQTGLQRPRGFLCRGSPAVGGGGGGSEQLQPRD